VFWQQRRFSDETAYEIDRSVRSLLEGALNRAVRILQSNRPALDEGAAALLARETLNSEELPKVNADGAPQLEELAHDAP